MTKAACFALGLFAATTAGRAQSLTVPDQIKLTVTQIERLQTRSAGIMTESAPKDKEFARLTIHPEFLGGQTGNPCGVKSKPPLILAGDYQLIDATGKKVKGMDVTFSFKNVDDPCETYTITFQPTSVGAEFKTLRFKNSEADVSSVAGASKAAN